MKRIQTIIKGILLVVIGIGIGIAIGISQSGEIGSLLQKNLPQKIKINQEYRIVWKDLDQKIFCGYETGTDRFTYKFYQWPAGYKPTKDSYSFIIFYKNKKLRISNP